MIELLPEKYDQLSLSSNEKSFIKLTERAFREDEFSYLVLQINPRKKGLTNDKAIPELFDLLVFKSGIVLFRHFEIENTDLAIKTINAVQQGYFANLENDISERLKYKQHLTMPDGQLKFAFSIKLVFPKVKKFELMGMVDETFLSNHCLLEEDLYYLKCSGLNGFTTFVSPKELIKESEADHIFSRLCPEIIIPPKYQFDDSQKIAGKDGEITIDDRSVKCFRLDLKQINFINKINKGNQLILACAGSGKSVLLISKCFKLAGLNPAEKFLITCYNKNLKEYYSWAKEQVGFSNAGQVEVMTFYGLCSELLKRAGIQPPSKEGITDSIFYDRLLAKAQNALSSGLIKDRYYGIFIDEVQIFEPKWYRFCYDLLKSKNEEDHFFVIAGDKSQDIKRNMNRGIAPWQGHGDSYPKYSSKTYHPIETNYRNSKPINDAIDKFVELAKQKGANFGIDLTSDPELFLRGIAYRNGDAPVIIENRDYSNDGEVNAIVREVKFLIESKQYSETDIAVVFYRKSGFADRSTWKDAKYDGMEHKVKAAFYREGWNTPTMLFSGTDNGTYGSRRGITIAAIAGALGLDYRAVVLAGLHSIGKADCAKTEDDFRRTLSDEESEKMKRAFIDNVNHIYTGCTRAKDSLSIILSIEKGNCVYSDLLRASIGGRR